MTQVMESQRIAIFLCQLPEMLPDDLIVDRDNEILITFVRYRFDQLAQIFGHNQSAGRIVGLVYFPYNIFPTDVEFASPDCQNAVFIIAELQSAYFAHSQRKPECQHTRQLNICTSNHMNHLRSCRQIFHFRHFRRQRDIQIKRFNRTYTDELLPVTKKEDIEKDAEAFLNTVRLFADCPTGRIDTIAFAKELGIRVYFAPISDDHSVRAEFFFFNTEKVMFDEKIGTYRTHYIPANTILVEKKLRDKPEIMRFTIMHELVHAVLQKYTFLLANMCNPGFVSFFCPIRLDESNQFVDPFTERMERYADMIASCALMPQTMFKFTAEKRLRDCGCMKTPYVLKQVLEETAKEFGVSVAACRRRYIQLGYPVMHGICQYIDGAYVPPYCFNPDSLEKNQTYTVSLKMAQEILKKNPKLKRMMMKGRLRFVEHHFVIADPRYVTKDMQLTDYAREHLNECAVKIDLVYPAGYYSKSRFELRDDGAYRTIDDCTPLNANYAKNNDEFELAAQQFAEQLQRRDAAIIEVMDDLPESFPKALKKIIAWTELNQDTIAEKTKMDRRTLQRLMSGDIQSPSTIIVMRICIGLAIPIEISLKLLERSGNVLRSTQQDMAYMQLLFFSGYYTIEQCNRLLMLQGVKPLSLD